MTVVSTEKNVEDLTLTFVVEFDASVERVWQLWQDPRQLERWWGPPGWPATFYRHDFTVGGRSSYYMTGPDGEKGHGWWQFTAIEAPHRLEFDDGFADEQGNPLMPIDAAHGDVTVKSFDDKTRMTVRSTFTSADQLERMMAMGMEEGMREALGQIDAILAEAVV